MLVQQARLQEQAAERRRSSNCCCLPAVLLLCCSALLCCPTLSHLSHTALLPVHNTTDAGASLTFPQQAGTIRKNGYMVAKGRPCKVKD